MEPALILMTSTVLLAVAALGGLVMAGMRFAGRPHPPPSLAMLHGLLAGAALTLLIYAACTVGLPSLANGALLLLIVASIGGLVLNLNYQWKQVALPKWLVVVHAAVAVVGFLLLVMATWAVSRA
jgi:hypothetical protein